MRILKNAHAEDVKAAVRKRGKSLTEIARDAGLHDSTCRAALLRPIPAGNAAIAKFIDRSLNQLWPEWYDAQGNRLTARKAA